MFMEQLNPLEDHSCLYCQSSQTEAVKTWLLAHYRRATKSRDDIGEFECDRNKWLFGEKAESKTKLSERNRAHLEGGESEESQIEEKG